MQQFMVIVFVVLFLGYQFASAQETGSSWLIGRWDGNIEGFKGEGGPARMLRVHSISAEGAIVSLLGVPPQTEGEGSRSRWMARRLRFLYHPKEYSGTDSGR